MKYYESKQIHSCFASFSTNDAFVYREITLEAFESLSEIAKETTLSDKFGFGVVYTKADEYWADKDLKEKHRPSEKEFAEYVAKRWISNGWTEKDEFLESAQKLYWAEKDEKSLQQRAAEGYVIPRWEKDLPVETYKGGFSDAVFNNSELQPYLIGGGCFGYIGHSVRKPGVDAYLESSFLKASGGDVSLLAMWLTSTGGRHFGDSLEDSTFDEQKEYIDKSVGGLVVQAKSYKE